MAANTVLRVLVLLVVVAVRPPRVVCQCDSNNEGREKVLKKFGATCGRAKAATEVLVVNGINTASDEMPWHAGIYRQKNGSWERVCGGTLVAPSTVVTAAHCVANASGIPLPAAEFAVALGKTLSGWDAEVGDETIYKSQVKMIHVPTGYRGAKNNYVNDIAVLELFSCATLGDRIFPVCVDGSVKGDEKELLTVPVWGNDDDGSLLAKLESVQLPLMSTEECRKVMDSNPDELAMVTDDKICSFIFRNQSDAQGVTHGNSGGGAFIKRGGRDGLWYFQGVVSNRMRAKMDGVDVFVYGFTDVTARHLGWISRYISW